MIVVADTSVFLNLVRINQADLLRLLYGNVLAPPEVKSEFDRAARQYARFAELEFPKWVTVQSCSIIPQGGVAGFDLDPGESAAITLAQEVKADLVLIDEELGRKAARRLGLRVAGLLGVLLEAKRSGRINELAPLVRRLETEAQFWLDQSTREVLFRLADERE